MSDVEVDYRELEAAAKAAATAATQIEAALTAFASGTELGGDDFTVKGEDVLTWYEGSRTNFVTLLRNSHTSFGQFHDGFAGTALLFRLLDEQAAKAGKSGKP